LTSVDNIGEYPQSHTWYAFTTWVLLLSLCSLVCFTFADYGVAFDEYALALYGDAAYAYFASLGKDIRALTQDNLYFYGPLVSIGGLLFKRLFSFLGEFEGLHLYGGLIGVVGIAVAGMLAREAYGDRRAMFFSALTLCFTFRYSGEAFNNLKDVPFAVAYGWTLLAMIRFVRALPRPPLWTALHLGLAIGVLLSIRVGGVFVWGFLLAALLFELLTRKERVNGKDAAAAIAAAAFVLVVSYSLMLLAWPWAQGGPLVRPITALYEASHFPWNGKVLFQGDRILAVSIPRTYALVWLLISTPVFFLVVLLLSLYWFWRKGLFLWRSSSRLAAAEPLLHLAWMFPLAYSTIFSVVLYDGIRHLLFIFLPIAVIVGGTISQALEALRRHRFLHKAVVLIIAAAYLRIGAAAWRLHPYEYVYFNDFIGGLAGAAGRFETEYWGTSFKEGALWLAAKPVSAPIRVASSQHWFSTAYYLRQSSSALEYTADRLHADYYLSTLRDNDHLALDWPIVYEVQREGVPIVLVRKK
jgi:hypothetical protein